MKGGKNAQLGARELTRALIGRSQAVGVVAKQKNALQCAWVGGTALYTVTLQRKSKEKSNLYIDYYHTSDTLK